MKREALKALLEKFGQKYSEILGIKLETSSDEEAFKWFLASLLFGAPITESSVIKTYGCFQKYRVLSPEKILKTGWDGLVRILDEGSYVRYDFKTADKLLLVMTNLEKNYSGSLNLLHREALDSGDLEKRLKQLGKGVGDVTVSIFLRDLREIWKKADPRPTPLVILGATSLGIIKGQQPEKILEGLKEFWNRNSIKGFTFVNFETALLRLGKEQRKRKR
ncbi:MAG TPA: hypothetical protein VK487_04470 [Candidatus Bathyarchaeia archaeon]|nr:hypothetical protein [Candidatus Bathyarchaeia archaeon]